MADELHQESISKVAQLLEKKICKGRRSLLTWFDNYKINFEGNEASAAA